MKPELDNQSVHRYMRVYNYYKQLILSQQLAPGSRLPSIRRCAAELQMSRTTVETAYMVLAAEGYIISRPQSGFYVTDIGRTRKTAEFQKSAAQKEKKPVLYNFASASVDRETFRFELWRRYIKSALRQDERLLSYGEPQGEYDLREVLCRYLQNNRNVVCTPEHIVIGAGVQSLLHILCPLIEGRKKIAFYNPGFRQGRAVFEDHGFELCDRKQEQPDVCYVSPSQATAWGDVLSVGERMKILREASEKNILLIEDDYNSEFCYYHHPSRNCDHFMAAVLNGSRLMAGYMAGRHPKRNRSHCVSLSGMVIWKVRFANLGNTIWRKQKFCAVKRKGFL